MPLKEKIISVPEEGPIPDGTLIRARRKFLNLSGREVTRRVGVSYGYFSAVETGNKGPGSMLERLREIFGMDPEELRAVDREQVQKWLDRSLVTKIEEPFSLTLNTKFGKVRLRILEADVLDGRAALLSWLASRRRPRSSNSD